MFWFYQNQLILTGFRPRDITHDGKTEWNGYLYLVLKPGMTHLKARDYGGQEISLKDTCYNAVERIFFRLNF